MYIKDVELVIKCNEQELQKEEISKLVISKFEKYGYIKI